MPQESIGSIDTGKMPENEDRIMLCWNLIKRHIEFVYGQVPVVRGLGIIRHDRELGPYPSMGV